MNNYEELNDAIAAIQNQAFEAEMNIFSGVSLFIKAITHDVRVDRLTNAVSVSEKHQYALYKHIEVTLLNVSEPQYTHPFDAGIAAMIYALCRSGSEWGEYAIQRGILCPQTWWLKLVVSQVASDGMANFTTIPE